MVSKKENKCGKYKRTEETKRKISENKDRAKKISASLKNRTFSEEWKKKLRENHWSKNGIEPWNKGINQWKDKEHPRGMKGKKHSEISKKNISNSTMGNKNHFFGKQHSVKTINKIKESLDGKLSMEKNPMWKGGKSFEEYGVDFNNKFKTTIRKRDNQKCFLCNIKVDNLNEQLHIHHIDYNKRNNVIDNCVSLCRSCHMRTNNKREFWTSSLNILLSNKYNYKYPNKKMVIEKVNKK